AAAVRNGLLLPDGYGHALLSYLNERRAVQYADLPASAVAMPAAPSDAILTAYIAKHPERYSTPEYRDVTYASIGPDDLVGQLKVTDAQLRTEFARRQEEPLLGYVVPE